MIVSAASRMSSAISLGVFWRLAPSTIAIMRSRNVSPGFAATRTTSQSESTRVPPVTDAAVAAALADDRRALAGDADLVDRGDAFDDLAVARDRRRPPRPGRGRPCAASPTARRAARGVASCLGELLRRRVALARLRSASACALPRPSAIASAKFANSTVNQSQSDTARMNPARRLAVAAERLDPEHRREDAADLDDEHHRVAPLVLRASSFTNASTSARADDRSRRTACAAMSARSPGACERRGCSWRFAHVVPDQREVLDDRAQGERRDERERADDDDRARRASPRRAACAWAACPARRHDLLRRERAGDGERRHREPVAREATSRCRAPCCRRACWRRGPRTRCRCCCRPTRTRRGSRRSRARRGWPRPPCPAPTSTAIAVPTSTTQRRHEDRDRRHLHLEGLDLLAEVFGRAADHQAGDEDRDDREHEHAVEARAHAAEDDLAELDEPQRHEPAQRREGVVHRVDRAVGGRRRRGRPERRVARCRSAPPCLPCCRPAAASRRGLIGARLREQRVARLLCARRRPRAAGEDDASSSRAPPSPGACRRTISPNV